MGKFKEVLSLRFGVSGSARWPLWVIQDIVCPPQSQTQSPPGLVCENSGLISLPALTTPVIRIPWVQSPGSWAGNVSSTFPCFWMSPLTTLNLNARLYLFTLKTSSQLVLLSQKVINLRATWEVEN